MDLKNPKFKQMKWERNRSEFNQAKMNILTLSETQKKGQGTIKAKEGFIIINSEVNRTSK